MSNSLFSQSWYRLASLKPRLRSHVEIHRHHYRGELWYVLQDHAAQCSHRLNPSSYFLVAQMNGQLTVQQVWDVTLEKFGDEAPDQNDVIQLLGSLYSADVLQFDVMPEANELHTRSKRIERKEKFQRFINPMALRFPLLDPEKFLSRLIIYLTPVYSKWGLLIWTLTVTVAIILAASNWELLTQNVADRVLAPANLIILWVAFPVVKALHELGHAFAVKRWGGEVHEIGIMLLVFFPVPYVDASAASGFRDKKRRMIVGAGGMFVELFIASLALFAWLNLEPGVTRSFMYNVMLIAGVSTVLFNGNPLLRFDGYYILSDFIEIPNLGSRATKYIGYLARKYLLRLSNVVSTVHLTGEKIWFVFFGVASFVYRMIIGITIALFIASKFFYIGIILALWVTVAMIIIPSAKIIAYLLTNQELHKNRRQAIFIASIVVTMFFVLLVVMPVPFFTISEGVVWTPEESYVRAKADGFVENIIVQSGESVLKGQPLIVLRDIELATEIDKLIARKKELEAKYRMQRVDDYIKSELTAEELKALDTEISIVDERFKSLSLKSPVDGVFILPEADDLPGRYVRHGQLIGYVLKTNNPLLRAVVMQDEVDLVRQRTKSVDVKFASNFSETLAAILKREIPAASDQLPSIALAKEGGGNIANDPYSSQRNVAYQTVFQFELSLVEDKDIHHYGDRVFIRFNHGYAPLAEQWYRQIKQLVLSIFHD